MQKIIITSLLFLITLTHISCSDEERADTLTGLWEPATRPYNLGTTLIFDDDSSFTQIKDARVNYTYKLIGDTLISISLSGLTGEKIIDSARVIITSDTLTLIRGKIGDQQETIMKKYDSVYTDPDGIIGFWKWPHQSGRTAVSEYHPDGKAAVSVIIERKEGNYFVNGDSLTVIIPGTSLRDLHFELKGDSLFFPAKFAPFGTAFYRQNKKDEKNK